MPLRKQVAACFRRLEMIRLSHSEVTPQNWCEQQPCVRINLFSRDIILTQPSSTFYVYLLGLLTIAVGVYFLMIQDNEVSRFWWGISLLLWGIGAILAGTSYQAFAYEIKCAGRRSCCYTSWWEVVYLMFQYVSVSILLVAVAYSSTAGSLRVLLLGYAVVSSALYILITMVGALVPIRSLITFNLMVWASMPAYMAVLLLAGWRYLTFKNSMDLALLTTWLLLLLTSGIYYIYDELNITEKLWRKGAGTWFSQNDVLHVGLILWMVYIAAVVAHQVKDHALPVG